MKSLIYALTEFTENPVGKRLVAMLQNHGGLYKKYDISVVMFGGKPAIEVGGYKRGHPSDIKHADAGAEAVEKALKTLKLKYKKKQDTRPNVKRWEYMFTITSPILPEDSEEVDIAEASGSYHGYLFNLTPSEVAAYDLGRLASNAKRIDIGLGDFGEHFISDRLMKGADTVLKSRMKKLKMKIGTWHNDTDSFSED